MTKARSVRLALTVLVSALVTGGATFAQGDTTTGAGNAAAGTGDGTSAGAIRSTLSPQTLPATVPAEEVVYKSSFIARQLAREDWFDKAAAANPRLVAAVCSHAWAANIVAKHRHLAAIADADPYLCRRLTQWPEATFNLLRNPQADHVIERDPQGIYYAIAKRPSVARLVAGHQQFYHMVEQNPDLGNFIIAHMK